MAQTSIACDQKGEYSVKPNVNIEIADEYNVGCAIESDMKEITAIRPQLVWKPTWTGLAWLRADVLSKVVMSGCTQKYFGNLKVSSEGIYGWGDKFVGIKNWPVQFRGGMECELSDDIDFNTTYSFTDTYKLSVQLKHKVNKNWTIEALQSYDSANADVTSRGPWSHIGFAASYKL